MSPDQACASILKRRVAGKRGREEQLSFVMVNDLTPQRGARAELSFSLKHTLQPNTMLKHSNRQLVLLALILALVLVHGLAYTASEPFFNNDETRHVMTGLYFNDLLRDRPVRDLRDYTIHYYLQYPALGLLVWPPFFYFIEGLLMSVFGTSLIVSKALVVLFAAMACAYLFHLSCHSYNTTRAAVAVLIFGLSPLVFDLSRYVMLEVPTLALALAATYHFVRYLDLERRRDLLLAGLASALASLTRFDAVYLWPLFLILLIARKRLEILWRREVMAVAALALLLVAPCYALSAAGIGWMHFKSITETLSPSDPGFFSLRRLLFYPSRLPSQLGLAALIPAVVGLIFGLTSARRQTSWPYLAIILATYLTFTPMGEVEPRHTVYWIPAFALFAADGVALIANWLRAPSLFIPLAAPVLITMGWTVLAGPPLFVRGYADAARYVAENSETSPYCLFVGRLNGDFIYQIRRLDPDRRLWVLRADHLLFSILIVPGMEYRRYASTDQEILATILKYDPEFIVVEEPQTVPQIAPEDQIRTASEEQVRRVLGEHPERFRLEKVVAVTSNAPDFRGMRLKVLRNVFRNRNPERRLNIEILMLRRSFQTVVP